MSGGTFLDVSEHPWFQPWTDPDSGMTSYVLTKRVAPFQRSMYHTIRGASDDGAYVWFSAIFPPSDHFCLAVARLSHVDEKLEDELGMNLVWPHFTRYDPDVGSMSGNHPGIAENGVYIHAGCFKLVADCMAGRAEAAWRLLHKILPDHADNPVSRSRCTPFALTNSWRGAEGECYGLTGSQWRTGTSGWAYRAMIEFILGVRRGYDGLAISPCLPAALPEARIERWFRGNGYRIHIVNGATGPSPTLTVNGKATAGRLLPLGERGAMHDVRVSP